jgi:hypothetical protein
LAKDQASWPEAFAGMRKAGRLVAECLDMLVPEIRSGVATIDPYVERGVFEPEATAAMGEALEAACKELHGVGQLQMVRKVIAQRIIAAARGGELDPVRLRAAALSWIISQMSPAASR